MTHRMLAVGGYTDRDDLPEDTPYGLALHDMDAGAPRLIRTLPITNATWLEWDATRRVLYVSQSSTTTISAISIPDGPASAQVLDEIDICARNPAHFAFTPEKDAIVAACFTAGEVVTVALSADGRFDRVSARTSLSGRGNAEPHQISSAEGGFAVPDRARDAIHRFAWRNGAEPMLIGSDPLPSGRGPRHLARHPYISDVAYLGGEFDSTLTTLSTAGGSFVPLDEQSTLPTGFVSKNSVAAVFPDRSARRLYVSNRGHDSLAVFDITDPFAPRRTGWIPAGGKTPRFADELAPGVLAIAALDSHAVDLVSEHENPATGGGTRVRIPHGAPACVRLIDLDADV